MSHAEILQKLQDVSISEGAGLNMTLRNKLQKFAEQESLEYSEDCIGNVYIQTPGTDSGLANIGIAFPLDERKSSASFSSTVNVFDELKQDSLACGLTLMGYTSVDGSTIGFDRWEAATPMSKNTTSSSQPEALSRFSDRRSPADFPLSALVEVCEEESNGTLSLTGTGILTAKAQKSVPEGQSVKTIDRKCPRAPYMAVRGPSAELVAKGAIAEYSSYVVKLFDNFD